MAQGSMDSDRLSSAGISTHSSGTAGTLGGSVVGVRVGENGHKQHEDEYNLGPLPPMWEKAFTPTGEAYFIDHNTGTSHWLDPRLARVRKHSLGECNEHELPYGWERVSDERYGCYYVDHINRRTQYENPVLQARRLRAEKMSAENGPPVQSNGPPVSGELRGDRFTVTLTKGTQGLGFTLIGAEGIPETEGYLQIRSIVPHSPAWIDGALRPGDVVVGVGNRGVRGLSHAAVAQIFQCIGAGSEVTLHLVRGYPLSFDSEDPNTRVLSTLAVDASNAAPSDAAAMQQLTRALRTRFNLDSPNTEAPQLEPATPTTPHHSRLMSRSFDLDELTAQEPNPLPPRCPSADLLNIGTDVGESSIDNSNGVELSLSLRRGAAGFGFTIADSVHGQKVKKVLDRSRCAGLREGDLLLQIGEHHVRHAPHQRVVQVLKDCPALHETTLRVWRRNANVARAPRSRSATRVPPTPVTQVGSRSKTPTAEQLRAQDCLSTRINNITTEATYAVPEHKPRERESLIDRRRRSSTPGGRMTLPGVAVWNEPERGCNQPPNNTEQWNHDGQINNGNQWQNEKPSNGGQWDTETQSTNERTHGQWQEQAWIDNSNVRNWAESTQKWENNNQLVENGLKWDSNSQKWDSNSQKWDSNGQKWDSNGQKWEGTNGNGWDANGERWTNGNWGEVGTPTVHVDMTGAYWRGNASVADSSDNGGFPEDGMPHTPTTAAVSALPRHSPSRHRHSPAHSGHLLSQSPLAASASDRLLGGSPCRPPSHSGRKGSPMRLRESSPPHRIHSPYDQDGQYNNYQQEYPSNYPSEYPGHYIEGAVSDPDADVMVRLTRGAAGFGFRIVGGTEDGSRVAVGYVVPGGPADGLLRPGDLLTSVDGVRLAGATHTRAVAAVCHAAAKGHATLGVRHNRADVHTLQQNSSSDCVDSGAGAHPGGPTYNIVHPAPLYPAAPPSHTNVALAGYSPQYGDGAAWSAPYDITVSRQPNEGFGFVVISSTNKATSTIGQVIPGSPAARCGLLHVGDTILAINGVRVRNLPHPEVVALIKRSGPTVTLTILPPDASVD